MPADFPPARWLPPWLKQEGYAEYLGMLSDMLNQLSDYFGWDLNKPFPDRAEGTVVVLGGSYFAGFRQVAKCGPVTTYQSDLTYMGPQGEGCGRLACAYRSSVIEPDANFIEGFQFTSDSGVPGTVLGTCTEKHIRLGGYVGPAPAAPGRYVIPLEVPSPEPLLAPSIDPFAAPIQKPSVTFPWPYWAIPYRPEVLPGRSPIEQPTRGPGPEVVPAPAPIVLPEPFPMPRPVSPLSPPTLVIETAPEVHPDFGASGHWAPPARGLPHPPPNERSRDVKPAAVRGLWQLMSRINATTELKDVVEAAYYALPLKCRQKRWKRNVRPAPGVAKRLGKPNASRKNLSGSVEPSVPRMMGSLMDCWDQIDNEKFKKNMIYNELQDRVFGTMGKALGQAARKDGKLFGYGAGPLQ